MSSWDLVMSGNYEEALIQLDREVKIKGEYSEPELNNRSMILIHLNRLDEAEESIKIAIAKENEKPNLKGDSYESTLGIIQWLKDEKEKAAETWYKSCDDMNKGIIKYSDLAGGVGVPCLLWFASRFIQDKNYEKESIKFLGKRIKSKKISSWPGPIAHYILGNISGDELIKIAKKGQSLTHRQLCQAYFYNAFYDYHNRDMKRYKHLLENAFREGKVQKLKNEYYLSMYELKRL